METTEELPGGRFEKKDVDEPVFMDVLGETVEALEKAGVDHVFIGGIPSAVWGRPRGTHDIDILVKEEDSDRAREALAQAGFDTHPTNPEWLYKAAKEGVVVDIIFRSEGDVYLDDEMLSRSDPQDFKGRPVRLVPPEDLVVMKAVAHEEDTPQYWHDALDIIGRAELDWEYLVRRAKQHGARRVLSLLLYAESNDLVVSLGAIKRLFDLIYPREETNEERAQWRAR